MSARLRWRPRRWGHWTLRSRLVVVVSALATVALIAANLTALFLMRSYLGDRIDERLFVAARSMTDAERPRPEPDRGPSQDRRPRSFPPSQPVSTPEPAATPESAPTSKPASTPKPAATPKAVPTTAKPVSTGEPAATPTSFPPQRTGFPPRTNAPPKQGAPPGSGFTPRPEAPPGRGFPPMRGAPPGSGFTPRPVGTTKPAPAPEPVLTPEPGATPEPDATPEPVPTPEPDATPEPGATPQPASTPEPATTPKPVATRERWPVPQPQLAPDQVVYVYGADGTLDADHSTAVDPDRPPVVDWAAARARARDRQPYTVPGANGATAWRLLAVPVGTGGVAVIGSPLADVEQTADRLLLIEGGVTALALVFLGVGAAFVVRLGLRPLTEMERLATAISAGNLSGRVADTDRHTEPGRLGAALNLMLARIEAEVSARTASEQRLRQFVGDASHELRTPLTSIRGFAELYRRGGARPGPQLDEAMSRIEGEAARMGVLVEDLLLLARLDLERPSELRPVDLLEIAADTIRDAHARVPDRPVRLAGLDEHVDTFDPVTVLGDEHELRQVATNLVANALRHTPDAAQVTVRVGRVGRHVTRPGAVRSGPVVEGRPLVVLEVGDDGPGVPAVHAPRVFERLYRADSSRTRDRGGGSGLGLSIVAAIVHGHGGWVELDPPDGTGATFRVLLPTSD